MISQRLRFAIKCSQHRQYLFAKVAGVTPSTLSLWLNDAVKVKTGDPRIVRIGAALGLSADECFAPDPTHHDLVERPSLDELRR